MDTTAQRHSTRSGESGKSDNISTGAPCRRL